MWQFGIFARGSSQSSPEVPRRKRNEAIVLAIVLAFVADYYDEKSALKWVGGILGLIDIFLALIVLGMLLSMFR